MLKTVVEDTAEISGYLLPWKRNPKWFWVFHFLSPVDDLTALVADGTTILMGRGAGELTA